MQNQFASPLTFITVLFRDQVELHLMQLQAYSFCMVCESIIGNIYVVIEGIRRDDPLFNEYEEIITKAYPPSLRHYVCIYSGYDYIPDNANYNPKFGWYNQQALKLLAACSVGTKYSIVLDAKNHFIGPVNLESFFTGGVPHYFLEKHAPDMRRFWDNSIDFFCARDIFANSDFKVQTVTPFVFNTESVSHVVATICRRSQVELHEALPLHSITEFFAYFVCTFCADPPTEVRQSRNSLASSAFHIQQSPLAVTIGKHCPAEHRWNSFANRMAILAQHQTIKTFSIHRGAIKYLDEDYKKSLIKFYSDIYSNLVVEFIKTRILYQSAG